MIGSFFLSSGLDVSVQSVVGVFEKDLEVVSSFFPGHDLHEFGVVGEEFLNVFSDFVGQFFDVVFVHGNGFHSDSDGPVFPFVFMVVSFHRVQVNGSEVIVLNVSRR